MNYSPWIKELFQAIDGSDAKAFEQFLAEDVLFRFGNAEPVHGRATVGAVVGGFFDSIASLTHDVQDVWEFQDVVISHGIVTYMRHDSSRLSVPFCNLFKMKNNLIAEYLIFADVSALYSSV